MSAYLKMSIQKKLHKHADLSWDHLHTLFSLIKFNNNLSLFFGYMSKTFKLKKQKRYSAKYGNITYGDNYKSTQKRENNKETKKKTRYVLSTTDTL